MDRLILSAAPPSDFPMDSIVEWMNVFHNAYPVVGILLILMLLDVCVGLCAATINKTVSSTVSQRGMLRKAVVILLVAFGAVLEPYAGDIPVARMISMFFILTQAISITENAARAGVPLPAGLIDTLEKLRDKDSAGVPPAPAPPALSVGTAQHVDVHMAEKPVVAAVVSDIPVVVRDETIPEKGKE